MTRVLITGGGTGGHVQPALAVAAELRRRDPDIALLYIGSATGLEARLAKENGIAFQAVSVGKLRRSKSVMGLLTAKNALDALKVPLGVVESLRAVRTFGPDVVLGTGGFVSVPTVVAAGLLRIPVITHEQTVTIGLANRLAGRFSSRIAVSFEGSIDELPKGLRGRAFVTGNPVRTEIFAGTKAGALERFGIADDDSPGIYVTGGAQGSRKVNHAVRDALPELLSVARVLHQCGEADADEMRDVRAALPDALRNRYVTRAFVERDEIGDAYAFADLVIGRSGAGTVTELTVLGKPGVFVPLEPSSQDEQFRNAKRLADAGAAVIVRQNELTGSSLVSAVRPLFESQRRAAMAASALRLGRPEATRDLVDAVLTLATP